MTLTRTLALVNLDQGNLFIRILTSKRLEERDLCLVLLCVQNHFGPSTLFWKGTYKLFWSGENCFGQIQIILVRFKLDLSAIIFIICTRLKQIGPNWYSNKVIWTVQTSFGQGIRRFHPLCTYILFSIKHLLYATIWPELAVFFSNIFFFPKTISCFMVNFFFWNVVFSSWNNGKMLLKLVGQGTW